MSKRSYGTELATTSSSGTWVAARKRTKTYKPRRGYVSSYRRAPSYKSSAKAYSLNEAMLKRLIKKQIESSRETKVYSVQSSGTLTATANTPDAGATILISPTAMIQGTDLNERIGNSIRLSKVTLQLSMSAGNDDNVVLAYAARSKIEPAGMTAAVWETLKRNGGNLQGIYTASGVADMQLPWNKQDFFVPYEEMFLMQPAITQEGATAFVSRSIDCTKWFNKTQNFGDAGAGSLQALQMFLSPVVTAATYCTYQATAIFEFTDA